MRTIIVINSDKTNVVVDTLRKLAWIIEEAEDLEKFDEPRQLYDLMGNIVGRMTVTADPEPE